MRYIIAVLMAIATIASFFSSCSSEETYAEKRQKELDAIQNFISRHNIKVISKEQFVAQGCTTDTSANNNQYVLFPSTGVYMQIEDKGTDGTPLAKGSSATVLSRYYELNINLGAELGRDTIWATNVSPYFLAIPDCFTVKNSSGTFTASFTTNCSMVYYYSSTSVPGGWLVPLTYINLGRGCNKVLTNADGSIQYDSDGIPKPGRNAIVNIIVPHDQGTSDASSNVRAMFYHLTYELSESQ